VTVKVNHQPTVDWTEPDDRQPKRNAYFDRRLSHGTFALQAHDPKSVVFFRNIRVKPLNGND
jgi:hypothetical protein